MGTFALVEPGDPEVFNHGPLISNHGSRVRLTSRLRATASSDTLECMMQTWVSPSGLRVSVSMVEPFTSELHSTRTQAAELTGSLRIMDHCRIVQPMGVFARHDPDLLPDSYSSGR